MGSAPRCPPGAPRPGEWETTALSAPALWTSKLVSRCVSVTMQMTIQLTPIELSVSWTNASVSLIPVLMEGSPPTQSAAPREPVERPSTATTTATATTTRAAGAKYENKKIFQNIYLNPCPSIF